MLLHRFRVEEGAPVQIEWDRRRVERGVVGRVAGYLRTERGVRALTDEGSRLPRQPLIVPTPITADPLPKQAASRQGRNNHDLGTTGVVPTSEQRRFSALFSVTMRAFCTRRDEHSVPLVLHVNSARKLTPFRRVVSSQRRNAD
jgi:hypothetical protein